jgi:predicted enzyme related to lactoylglutathione lyase
MSQPEQSGWSLPKHGEFCWTEIASSNAAECKAFYTNVFGWKFQDSKDAGEGFQYNEFSDGDGPGPVGGLYEINPEFFGGNAPPPHFMIYVAVDNVDESAEKAVALGGTIVNGPLDISKVGRMCVIKDPTGAAISLFTMNPEGITE